MRCERAEGANGEMSQAVKSLGSCQVFGLGFYVSFKGACISKIR